MTDLRFPIGRFNINEDIAEDQRLRLIEEIAEAPARLKAVVSELSAEQLDTPYRPGGWTARQVVHHLADSHLNSYIRFKLALTEEEPAIKTYHEDKWAELYDARTAPIDLSLALLESLHERWVLLLKSLTPSDWVRTFRHPDLGTVALDKSAGLYAWHGKHHVAHIASLRERNGW